MTSPALDETALEDAYARLERPLYNVVYRWLWNADESREIVQEAFLRLWKMRDRVDVPRLDPLVYRIAINLATSTLRRRRILRWVSLEPLRSTASPEPPSDQKLVRADEARGVRKALAGLPEDQRRALVLCELTTLRHAEIAEILGVEPGTVASRRHRALEKLRARLSEDDERPKDRRP